MVELFDFRKRTCYHW